MGSEDDYAPAQLLTLAGAKHAMAAADAESYKVSIAICDAAGITTLLVRNADGHSGDSSQRHTRSCSNSAAVYALADDDGRPANVQGREFGWRNRRVRHLWAARRAHREGGSECHRGEHAESIGRHRVGAVDVSTHRSCVAV